MEATLNEFLIEVELAAEVRTIGRGFSVFLFFILNNTAVHNGLLINEPTKKGKVLVKKSKKFK